MCLRFHSIMCTLWIRIAHRLLTSCNANQPCTKNLSTNGRVVCYLQNSGMTTYRVGHRERIHSCLFIICQGHCGYSSKSAISAIFSTAEHHAHSSSSEQSTLPRRCLAIGGQACGYSCSHCQVSGAVNDNPDSTEENATSASAELRRSD